ncbi:MAG TPA: galactokinase [Ilumatobacter sp.]|nr:galactokinase [Ilumatobacter sp.]
MRPAELVRAIYADRWGEPDLLARAPGRVNLIGEHTDYNDGFCLPMALPFETVVALGSLGDPVTGPVTVVADGFGETTIDPLGDPRAAPTWALHVAGCVALLAAAGVPAGGQHLAIATDIPTGASLSSSAAVEVAVTVALLTRAGVTWSPIELARFGQRVEHEVVGVPTGILDQYISAGAVAGHASLMDCRALTLTPVPLPAGAVVAVLDSGTRRRLADAAYADRRASCERAAAALGVAALRDATLDQVGTLSDPVDRSRARHVVTENTRTEAAALAMRNGDAIALGRLMRASHASLRDDYEVSGPGLDAIVAAAEAAPGCLGARMTGGGFAGCAVALVEADRADEFTEGTLAAYTHTDTGQVWIGSPAAGASVTPV